MSIFSRGILGINERNLRYIRPNNPRAAIHLADDKLATKELLKKIGIKTPRIYGVISDIQDFETFAWDKLPSSFVIKPNRGFGGGGIVVLRSSLKQEEFLATQLTKRTWLKSNGEEWGFRDLKSHVLDILDGSFSLSGVPDVAFFERRVIRHTAFREYIKKGLPDVRIVVYNHVPVMAMLRLPTLLSEGKANLAEGAIGVGIDIGSGITTTAITKVPTRKIIEHHPDTGKELHGFEIPFWNDILAMSVEAQLASHLGYLGVDVAIDRDFGPEILELNARPGLEIQLANLDGLAKRLDRVDGLSVPTVEKGVRISKEIFGGAIDRMVEEVSGKRVLKGVETVKILTLKGTRKVELKAKIDTGADSSSISLDTAKKLGFPDLSRDLEPFLLAPNASEEEASKASKMAKAALQKAGHDILDVIAVRSSHGLTLRPVVPAVFFLADDKIVSRVNIVDREKLSYPMIVGKRDLKHYLIDAGKS